MFRLVIATAVTLGLAPAGPALAACYEDIGCTDSDYFSRPDLRRLSCNALWEVRNQMYFENGYCFKTERTLDFFGDDDCIYEAAADVPLNKHERRNISTIVAVERQKHC